MDLAEEAAAVDLAVLVEEALEAEVQGEAGRGGFKVQCSMFKVQGSRFKNLKVQ